jgi:pimeloyl-ACP methyl ester carboxylesterase
MSTFVLIHGAYQGGWIWGRVAARLRGAGHAVFAPSLDGCAERHAQVRPGITTESHGDEVAALLFYEDLRDVVLVGTSTGGMVVGRAAEQARERIRRLVFADALVLFDGERVADVVKRPTAVRTELTSGPPREDIERRLLADLDPATRAWAAERCTMHPIAPMEEPVKLPRFWQQTWRASVIWCRRSANPPVEHLRRAAERLHANWWELDTGHYPMLSASDELARLIMTG